MFVGVGGGELGQCVPVWIFKFYMDVIKEDVQNFTDCFLVKLQMEFVFISDKKS